MEGGASQTTAGEGLLRWNRGALDHEIVSGHPRQYWILDGMLLYAQMSANTNREHNSLPPTM